VEFALVLPILLLLVLGLIDFGRAVQAYAAVANGAREGVRAAIIMSNSTGAVVQAAQAGATPLSVPAADVRVARSSSSVTVSVTASFTPVTPLIGRVAGGTIRVVGIATLPAQ
jgi:Flp pilus assembly protein TadG